MAEDRILGDDRLDSSGIMGVLFWFRLGGLAGMRTLDREPWSVSRGRDWLVVLGTGQLVVLCD